MRKAFFLVGLVCGIAAMPLAAAAQDQGNQEQPQRQWRGGGGHRGGGDGGNRAPRQQQAQPQQQQAPQQPQQAAPAPQRELRQSEWVGDRNNPRMEAARQRYERLERQNARNYGYQGQEREVVQRQRAERQADGTGWQGRGGDDRMGSRRGRDGDNRTRNWNGSRDNRSGWDGRNDNRPSWTGGRADDRRGWNGNRGRNVNWSRDWRGDRRYDWQRYRNSNRFVFRVQPYYSPYRDWSYTRFGIGMFLDQLLFSRNYWISDPWTYRLPPVEPGLRWVRYYNDVVLVDEYTGEVVDVIYDFFW